MIPQSRIGVFGIGLAAYWPQFPGLKERLEGYQREVESRIWRVRRIGGLRRPGGYGRSGPGRRPAVPARRRGSDRLLRRHLRHFIAGAAGRAEDPRPGAGAEPATLGRARLREHRHGRVAGQLLGLLRARDLECLHARPHRFPGCIRHASRPPRGLERDRGLVPRRGRRPQCPREPHRLPGPHLPRHARHVLGLHGRARPVRRARGSAGDVRPRPARRRRHRSRDRSPARRGP